MPGTRAQRVPTTASAEDRENGAALAAPPAFLARFLDSAARLSADEVARIPTDAAENLDHYVYGGERAASRKP